MAVVGYVRVSTIDQNTDRQLEGFHLDRVFVEKASARDTKRPVLNEMLGFIREGDEVVVHDISRLARTLTDLHNLVEQITGKGCALKFLKEGLVFTGDADPMSELLLGMLGSVYAFERSMILERQKEGIALAKAKGRYRGRPKSIDISKIRELLESGLSMRKVAAQLGISLSSVQRAKGATQS